MAKHSNVVGGSSADRVLNCPGSVLLCQTVPRPPSSEFAIRGSMLHKVMQELLENPDKEPDDFEGMYYDAEKDELGHKQTAFQVTAKQITDKIVPALDWFVEHLDPAEYWVEQQVAFEDDIPGAFGTADVIYRQGGQCGIVDWKFGDGVKVSASDNSQMMFYLCGARNGGFLNSNRTEAYRAHIYQPSEKLHPDEYHSVEQYTNTQLDQFEDSLIASTTAAADPDAPLAAGDWCRWCPVNYAGKCPMLNSIVGTAVVKSPPRSMTPAQVGELLEIAELAEPWAKNIRKIGAELAEQGYPPPGWKLVQSVGNRRFIDEKKAHGMLSRAGVAVAEMYEKKFVSPAKADKLIKGADKPVSRNWSKNIERPERGTILVRNSDKRPAVNPQKALQKTAEYLKVMNLTRNN